MSGCSWMRHQDLLLRVSGFTIDFAQVLKHEVKVHNLHLVIVCMHAR